MIKSACFGDANIHSLTNISTMRKSRTHEIASLDRQVSKDLNMQKLIKIHIGRNVIPSGVPPTLFLSRRRVSDLGGVVKQQKYYSICLAWCSVNLCWILACFFEGVVGTICCSEIFELLNKNSTRIFQKINKIGSKGATGEPQIGPKGSPPEVPKNRSRNKRAGPGINHTTGSKMGA